MKKRFLAVFTCLCACALCLGVVGCGGGSSPSSGSSSAPAASSSASASSSQAASAAPQELLDPSTVESGMVWDNDLDNGTSDIWYRDGDHSADGIFITNAGNDAGRSVSWIDAQGTETDTVFDLEISPDKHLVNVEGTSGTPVDLAFDDAMTAYDYATDSWFIRGNLDALNGSIGNTAWTYDDTTFTFNEDGTFDQVQGEKSYAGTWEVASPSVLNVMWDGDSKPTKFRMVSDGEQVSKLFWGSTTEFEAK